ncbi:MAG TPA: hypothetical protein VMV92_27220 [Streptosporangiaceae bacterium]|nr:hypothetical protein [Streptosporangiaceae bacterium]
MTRDEVISWLLAGDPSISEVDFHDLHPAASSVIQAEATPTAGLKVLGRRALAAPAAGMLG